MVLNVYIVRHGEALYQEDAGKWKDFSDEEMPLTELGRRQAAEVGEKLKSLLERKKTLLCSSHYRRAYETAQKIAEKIKSDCIHVDKRFREQEWGDFTGLSTKDCYEKLPEASKKYDADIKKKGRFYAKAPKGESRFDVFRRASAGLQDIIKEAQSDNIDNIIIVAHSITLRSLSMKIMSQNSKWFDKEPNMPNGAVNQFVIDGDKVINKGYIFQPSEQGKTLSIASAIEVKKQQNKYKDI